MEGFSYYNIFETKGQEYLVIIAFLALLIPFSILLNRKVKNKRKHGMTMGVLTSSILKIPQGVFYCKNHTWAYLLKSGYARLGLDDLLLHFTGNVGLKFLKTTGDTVFKGEVMAELVVDGKMLKVYSPVSGRIEEANLLLTDDPGMINEDPYDNGWLYKVKPSNWKEDTKSFYLADSATEWSKKELQRFKDFLASTMPKYDPGISLTALQDGGELRNNILAELPGEIWIEFQQEFMNP